MMRRRRCKFQHYAKELGQRAGGQAQLFVEENVEAVGSHKYWSVTAVAKKGGKLEQWATFFVRLDGKEILVVDQVVGERMSLKDWRTRLAKK
jgi:hypoxanthine phosphoribosyltransferase